MGLDNVSTQPAFVLDDWLLATAAEHYTKLIPLRRGSRLFEYCYTESAKGFRGNRHEETSRLIVQGRQSHGSAPLGAERQHVTQE